MATNVDRGADPIERLIHLRRSKPCKCERIALWTRLTLAQGEKLPRRARDKIYDRIIIPGARVMDAMRPRASEAWGAEDGQAL